MKTSTPPLAKQHTLRTAATLLESPELGAPSHASSAWAWHHRTLLKLRDRLMRAHTEHAGQIATPLDTSGIDLVDTTQDQLDRDVLWAELGADNEHLQEIDAALQRIRNGTYGRCEATGDPIPTARLRALPWTRYCRAIAEQIEASRTTPKERTGRIFLPSAEEAGD